MVAAVNASHSVFLFACLLVCLPSCTNLFFIPSSPCTYYAVAFVFLVFLSSVRTSVLVSHYRGNAVHLDSKLSGGCSDVHIVHAAVLAVRVRAIYAQEEEGERDRY